MCRNLSLILTQFGKWQAFPKILIRIALLVVIYDVSRIYSIFQNCSELFGKKSIFGIFSSIFGIFNIAQPQATEKLKRKGKLDT